jgi:nucleotide-binding universal stress UspA family protein
MFANIVFPINLEGVSEQTIVLAAMLARDQAATLHLIYVLDRARDFEAAAFTVIEPDTVTRHVHGVEKLVAAMAGHARALGARAESHVVDGGPAWRMILVEAGRLGADLILMQTHGRRGIARAVTGSVTEEVLRHATIPVLAVREPLFLPLIVPLAEARRT